MHLIYISNTILIYVHKTFPYQLFQYYMSTLDNMFDFDYNAVKITQKGKCLACRD